MVQIRNHHSKSEVLIQSETALNAGEEDHSMDQLEATHQRKHKDARYFWIPEQVQGKDFSMKKEKNCANIGRMPITASVLQCCSNGKMGVLQGHGSHTPLPDEGEAPMMDLVKGAADPIRIQRPEVRVCAEASVHNSKRTPKQIQGHQHRKRNRQLSMLIVNIETDAQTE